MTPQIWKSLTPVQQQVMVVAMYLRNAMEDFHVKHLSDGQMAELNPLLRQALFDIYVIIDDDDLERQAESMRYLISMIPDYWEIPTEVSAEASWSNGESTTAA